MILNRIHQEHSKGALIPDGELPCIWMTAGIISYKLCDFKYECEKCPLDTALKCRSQPPKESSGREGLTDKNYSRYIGTILMPFQYFLLKENLYYHSGHTWVDIENPEDVKIGIDDFAAKLLPKTSMVISFSPQSHLIQNRFFCWIIKNERKLPILAPLNGSITVVNPRLREEPELLYQDPYGKGWLITIQPNNLQCDLKKLWSGAEAFAWYQEDVERLRQVFTSVLANQKGVPGTTRCDGGEQLIQLPDIIGLKRYFEMVSQFFR